ncbi:hypothetical protein LCGC14_0987910 [marine sediment metagenome]|uniref:Uncharacterized protein n=1 Tax=marine sediment metagenome TaxID=412755 RepID=A0A0F9QQ06_9ZZZZ
MEALRKHNTSTTVYFPMIKAGEQNFAQGGDWTPAAADTQVSIDGGAFANSNNLPAHEGSGMWSLVLDAAEVNGKVIAVAIIDAATKAVEDQSILVATYGNASSSIEVLPADVKQWLTVAPNALIAGRVDTSVGSMASAVLTAASIAANALTAAKIATDAIGTSQLADATALKIVDAILKRDMDQVEATAPVHSLAVAILKAVSRVRDNAGVEQTFETDGSTLKMQRTLTADPTNQPLDEAAVGTS